MIIGNERLIHAVSPFFAGLTLGDTNRPSDPSGRASQEQRVSTPSRDSRQVLRRSRGTRSDFGLGPPTTSPRVWGREISKQRTQTPGGCLTVPCPKSPNILHDTFRACEMPKTTKTEPGPSVDTLTVAPESPENRRPT